MATKTLPYENTSAGPRALGEIQKFLQGFGCTSFGSMLNWELGELVLQFEHKSRRVSISASFKGYAAAYLKCHPYTSQKQRSRVDYEKKALEIGSRAVYSILRDWIKGQITAIEVGMLTFEAAFLGQILLPNGNTVIQQIKLTPNILPGIEHRPES